MRRRGDRLNRVSLAVIAFIVMCAALTPLPISYQIFGPTSRAHDPLIADSVANFVDRNRGWFWPVAMAAALLLVFLSYRWLRAQFRSTPRNSHLSLNRGEEGNDRILLSSLARAFAHDVVSRDGVIEAQSNAIARGRRLDIECRVVIDHAGSVATIGDELNSMAVDHLRKSIHNDDVHLNLRVGFAPRTVLVD